VIWRRVSTSSAVDGVAAQLASRSSACCDAEPGWAVKIALGAGAVEAHVVRRPADAELVAAGRQLANEVRQLAVVRVGTGLGAQVGYELRRHPLPVGIEVDGGRVEEREAGAVCRLFAAVEHRRIEGAAERVGADLVEPGIADERRRGDLVEDLLDDRPDALLRSRASHRDRVSGAGQIEEVRALGVIELECTRERVQHELGDAADVAAFQALVVLDAHPGERGDLLAAQARHAALAVVGQARCSGVILARRVVRNSAMSFEASTSETVGALDEEWGALPIPLSQGLSPCRESRFPQGMRAAIFNEPHSITVGERRDPAVSEPTDAVVRAVLACVCGSELWYYRGDSPFDPGPIGHEFIGIVEDVGAEVRNVAKGELVICPFAISDGTPSALPARHHDRLRQRRLLPRHER
jgi:Alcohol dehydrogenase GroES-like domain